MNARPWRVDRPTPQPEERPRIDDLIEPNTGALPVRITIVQDDVTTGWDDGALGFDEDAVWFSGRACSFRVAAPDVLPGAYLLSRTEAVTDGEARNQGLPLRHPTREVWVRIAVLTGGEEARRADEARLIEGIKRIRAASSLSPPGERVRGEGQEPFESEYPPLAVRPGLFRPARSLRIYRSLMGAAMALLVVQAVHITFFPKLMPLRAILGLPAPFLLILSARFAEDGKLRRFAHTDDPPSALAPPPSEALEGLP